MCLGRKDRTDDPAPKPVQTRPSSSTPNPKVSMPQDYAPPPGLPPSRRQGQSQPQSPYYPPPPGPPPSHSQNYQPPAGPPPPPPPPSSDTKNNPFFNNPPIPSAGSRAEAEEYAPPPGPPPSSHHKEKPAPQHDWEAAVPDTALLPPPPDFFAGYDRSPANNASEDECEAGESWCRANPLYHPTPANANTYALAAAAQSGNVTVYAPPFFFAAKKKSSLDQLGPGASWRARSARGCADTCLTTWPPLYQVAAHSPLATGRGKVAYYEVRILRDEVRPGEEEEEEVPLALGFCAPPYPAFRLPGWHRGSVAVHGDDGHRYVNDRWGGKDFTERFRVGETIGLGMEFRVREEGGLEVQVFLTRDGVERGRWDLHEETDREQDLPVTGLEGYHDLCASVGVFGKLGLEIVFKPAGWMWRGYEG
ncbi:uncharacterized protein F4807DRAFT_442410 [Annulohypoxylon truncatum]|uniref:uncharacterized protein n=1 Tax=Annulohypoxylon truncatum TaxID=327061 RepID=UPI002008260B|nr:uncharacterized protein F4807DRAFT_442410 [Annulohypoxylon truncatum]KAI1205606.1 hypothetical protein F4807DRAFT_442410 [Annulohypoxylon truncatum]